MPHSAATLAGEARSIMTDFGVHERAFAGGDLVVKSPVDGKFNVGG